MSVLIFAEAENGKLKKSAYELAYYGSQTATLMGTDCYAAVLGEVENAEELGNYGVKKVVVLNYKGGFDSGLYSTALAKTAEQNGSDVVIVSHSSSGKSVLGRLAIKLNAGSVSGVNQLPDLTEGFSVTKGVFSGKALAQYKITSENKVFSLMGNSIKPLREDGSCTVESSDLALPSSMIEIVEKKTADGTVPLPEAELVVSAGRGMKGPENWGIIDELADVLGATTACSRPVADTGWRPHHEHVGQTGIAIRPNLYIAIGISGAIQHLAGVNNSKTIVVINKDPEAPFFKAADYGVLADLFDVVPRLTEALKKYKSEA